MGTQEFKRQLAAAQREPTRLELLAQIYEETDPDKLLRRVQAEIFDFQAAERKAAEEQPEPEATEGTERPPHLRSGAAGVIPIGDNDKLLADLGRRLGIPQREIEASRKANRKAKEQM